MLLKTREPGYTYIQLDPGYCDFLPPMGYASNLLDQDSSVDVGVSVSMIVLNPREMVGDFLGGDLGSEPVLFNVKRSQNVY